MNELIDIYVMMWYW